MLRQQPGRRQHPEMHLQLIDYAHFYSIYAIGTSPATLLGATNREEAMTMKMAERFERIMMAAAFAEENEHGTAVELLREQREAERAASRPTTRPQPRQTLRAD
jgi:hypothetical protein